MAQTTIIGKAEVLQRAKSILKNQDLICFLGHCEKLTIIVAGTDNEEQRMNLIRETIGEQMPYIIKVKP